VSPESSEPCLILDQTVFAEAKELMLFFGKAAYFEAEARADDSRSRGNAVHFCKWRSVARLIPYLAAEEAIGTVH
jgi:hypothetical protein